MIVRARILTLLFTVSWLFALFSTPPSSAVAQSDKGRCFLFLGGKWTEVEQLTYSDCVWKVAALFENFAADRHLGQWNDVFLRVERTGKVYSAKVAKTPIWTYRQTITLPSARVCRYLNGYVMQPADTQRLVAIFGNLPCGWYMIDSGYLWQLDNYGRWQPIGPIYPQTPNSTWDKCSDPNLLALDYIPPGC